MHLRSQCFGIGQGIQRAEQLNLLVEPTRLVSDSLTDNGILRRVLYTS